jgi:oligoribonuclease (3'-5' exoribonuclease)
VNSYPYLWLDLETNGDPVHPAVLEVACILTGPDLEVWARYSSAVKPGDDDEDWLLTNRMPDLVWEMHRDNGLLQEVLCTNSPQLSQVEDEVVHLVKEQSVPGPWTLAGSGVATFDLPIIRGQMPELAALLHYRVRDVTHLRHTLIDAGRQDLVPPINDEKTHRAMEDVELHLAEYRYYLSLFREMRG